MPVDCFKSVWVKGCNLSILKKLILWCLKQDIFKVEATLPEDGDTLLNQEEWPSDDSGDDDYDPDRVEKRENSCSNNGVCSEGESSDDDDASSSYSLQSLVEVVPDDESMKLNGNMGLESTSTDFIGQGSGSDSDSEFVSGRRQRQSVDYRKLYDVSTIFIHNLSCI